MKVGSFNVRGLGSEVKKCEIASFCSKFCLDFCCLQETKIEQFSDRVGKRIWRDKDIRWCTEGAVGRSGGILTCWDDQKFACVSSWNLGGAVIVNGRWRTTSEEVCIINVYASCIREEKRNLWDKLAMVVAQSAGACTCIIGDFNSILEDGERAGSGWRVSSAEIQEFREFVEGSRLIDVALQGRKYTWYKPNGTCKSRIDRALINEKWAETWGDTGLRGLPRTISDHCALILQTKQTDWGPKPFRFINSWMSHPHFKEVVTRSWNEGGIEGWGSYVFKGKLKRLKEELKRWNNDHFKNVDNNISLLREKIQRLDEKDDISGLSEEEAAIRREATAQLILQMNNRRSLLAQKAKIRCLREGDVNSRLFHKAISKRRSSNRLMGLEIGGEWTEEPGAVKGEIKNYFCNLFASKRQNLVNLPEDLIV